MSGLKSNYIKKIVVVAMTVLLLSLMAYQVTGETAHEWIGMGMTALVIGHQILNRKWYGALFRGKYNPYRILTTVLNVLLLFCIALTAFCGMSMSGYAVPFLYGMAPVSFVRRSHLSMSHWSFVMMGLHLGVHVPAMTAGLKWKDRTRTVLTCLFTCFGGIGLYLFLRNGMPDYLFFRVPFAFLDYDKAGWLVFLENILMLSFWMLTGTQAALICRNAPRKRITDPITETDKEYQFITLRDHPELKDRSASWFHEKWGVPTEAYLECMTACLNGETEYDWYLCLIGDRIVGGLGVIENDFHDRKDLTPNVCAVYTEADCRCRGIAGRLLNMAVEDMRARGVSPLYLVTDHTGFYERYGWEFLCMVQGDGEPEMTRMYIHL